MNKLASKWLLLCVVVSALVLASCGGGGGGSSSNPVAQTPGFSASSSTLNFGNQLANPAATTTQSVTISNTGNANLTITDVSITGANKDDFQFVNLPARPITVVANSTPLRIDVSFKPGAAGDRVATVSIADNAGGPHTVTLKGKGTLPQVPAIGQVSFSEVATGSSSTKTVTVTNKGDGNLLISGIAASAGFTTSNTTPMTVAPGSSATLSVTFTPSSSAPISGQLNITSNASIQPVQLYGLGVAAGRTQSEDASVTLSPDTIAPAPASYPTTITVTIIGTPGTLFDAGATIANFGPGTTVGDGTNTGLPGAFGPVQVTGDTTTINTTATAQVTFDATVAPGPRFVIVKTGDHLATATFVVPPRDMPVADAGVTQVVDKSKNKTAHLDGSRSITTSPITVAVAQGGAISASPLLHYQWTLLSAPDGSTAVITDPSGVLCPPEFPAPCSVRPSFDVDKDGNYLVQLAVTDSNGNTTKNWVLVSTPPNGYTVPIADAGPDQKVAVNDKVTLDSSGSSNPDGEALTYKWTLVAPAGSTASLSSADAVAPTFTADLAGDYKLQLTVKDLHGKAASDTVLVSTTQTPPIANAGPNQKLNQGDTAQLDGSASHDPDGDTNLICSWYFVALPAASAAQMSNPGPGACATKPAFALDQLGDFVAQLTVADSQGNNSIAATLVSTNDIPPVAVIAGGHHQDANVADTVILDGSNSHDGAASALTYKWSFLSKPGAATNVSISNSLSEVTNIPQIVGGDYVVQLVVSNGNLTSLPTTVLITAANPGFSADHTSVDFGTQTVKTTSDSRSIVITNTGAGTLHVTDITITGASDFAFTSAQLPFTVAAGATATVNVTFTPSAGGSRSATLNIVHNAGAAAAITLTGTGTVPVVVFDPPSKVLNFISPVGAAAAPQTVKISNTGAGDLVISSITVTGDADFSVSPLTPQTVHSGQSANLTVNFTPASGGGRAATITITDNSSTSPETVALNGTGKAPNIDANPKSVAFGDQLVNTTSSPAKVVSITNTGSADLHITALGFTGQHATDYHVSPGAPITVTPSNSTNLSLTFAPATIGDKGSTSLEITYDGGNKYTVAVSGNGIAPNIDISANTTLSFSDTLVGNNATLPLTIRNSGTANLTVSGGVLSDSTNYQIVDLPTSPIQPGVSATGHIRFNPTTRGSHPATLTINSDALSGAATINLIGTGLQPGISLDKNSLPFGNQLIHSPSTPPLTITVTNNGNSPLHITALTLSGTNPGDFSTSGLPPAIDPNGTAQISVTFTPGATGQRNATLSIANDAGAPQAVNLTGTGTQAEISAPPLVFSTQNVGATGNASLTVSNSGLAPLHITGLAITANSAEFVVTTVASVQSPVVVPALGSTNINLTFTPNGINTRNGTLTINSDAAGNPSIQVALSGQGNGAIIGESPNPVDFGSQLINTPSAARPITVTNTGNVDLTITGLAIVGANGDFTFTPPAPLTVHPNQNTIINVTFKPTTATTETATLNITDNAFSGSHSVALTGIGTAAGAPTFNPGSFPFGTQVVNTTSAALSVTVTNPGSSPLHITALTPAGNNAADFTVISSLPITVGIAPNNTATISVTFKPNAAGARSAQLTLTDDANGIPNSQQSVPMSGTGAVSGINPTSLTFSGQLVGTTSTAQTVTFAYPAGASGTLTLSSVSSSNPEFAVGALVLPINLTAPGQSQLISVTFTPSVAGGPGPRSATLTITDNTGTYQVALTGTATAPGISVPASLQFVDQLVNSSSGSNPLTITNPGTAILHISSLSITGANATEFAFAALPPGGIDVPANNGTFAVNLTFTPTARGARTATLNIVDNASGSPHHVTLNGNGIAPMIAIAPNSVPFGNQTVNTSSNQIPVTISNTGDSPLHITAIVPSGPNTGDFTFTPPAPLTIAAGGNATLNVTFKPTTATPESATLTFTNDAISGGNTLALSGTGVLPAIGLNPTSPPGLSFGSQLVRTASSPLTLTITNTGLGTLSISDLSFTGANLGDFSFPAGFTRPTAQNPIIIQPNANTVLNVIFTPQNEGAESAALNITSNISPVSVALSGTGTAPHFAVAPSPANFPATPQGTPSAPLTITITNSGAADLSIANLAWGGANAADFAISGTPTLPITVAKNNGTATLNLVFTPSTSGTQETATLTFTDNTVAGTHGLTLNGSGTAPAMGPLSPLNFGAVDEGSSSTARNLTVTNTGAAPMKITGLGISGANFGDFAFPGSFTLPTSASPITVAANNGTTLIPVIFSPSGAGARNASLDITDNAPGSPHHAVLSGTGNAVPVFSAPSSLTFPDTAAGFSNALTLVIRNTGDANLRITTISKLGSNAPDFTYSVPTGVVGDCSTLNPCDVPAGQSLNVTVSFQPLVVEGAGPKSAILSFADNTPAGFHSVTLSGNSVAPFPILSYSNNTATPLTFPDTLVGTASGQLAVTITNSGTADATIPAGGAVISGTNAGEFTINTALPITVPKAVGGVNGSASIVITFTPADSGSRTATLTINPKNTFDNSNLAAQPVTLNGTAHYNGQFNLNSTSLGANLQALATGSMSRTWSTPLTVTITSSNTSVVLIEQQSVDPSGTSAGTGSFSATIPAGHGVVDFGFYAGFYIQAVAPGTANITISSPGSGFKPATATITVTNSGFVLETPAGTGANFTANLGADRSLIVTARQLDGAGNPLSSSQTLRGGSAVSVTVNSSATSKGTILNNPAVLQPGAQASSAVSFHPVAVGTTQVSVTQPTGFTNPASGATATATVTSPTISLNPAAVGFNQQVTAVGNLNQAPTSTVSVTITSDNAGIQLSTNAAGVGSNSVVLSVPANTTALPTFYVQGWGVAGTTATLTAHATGYTDATANAQVTGSAFVLLGSNNQLLGNFSTTTITGPTGLTLGFWQLDSSSRPSSQGIMRPGLSNVAVVVNSSNTSTGTITGSAAFNAGDSTNTALSFVPVPSCTTPCTTTLTVNQPVGGYSVPNGGGSVNVTVNKPTVTLRAPTSTIGQNLQVLASGEMDSTSNDNLYVTLSSTPAGNVLFSASPTNQGNSTLQFFVPAGTGLAGSGTFPNYLVQALGGSGTVTINAIVQKLAPDGITLVDAGFNVVPVIVTLAPSGFVIDGGNGVGGTIAMSNNTSVNLSVIAVVLDTNGAPTAIEESVRGGAAASVSVVSSNLLTATITGSPVAVTGGTSRNVVTVNAVALSPNPGTAVGIAPTPTGFSPPSFGSQLSVVIN